MLPISLLPDLVQSKIQCIMRFLHYDVMHYELINCIWILKPVDCFSGTLRVTTESDRDPCIVIE